LVAVTLATWATVQGAPELFGINAADKHSLIAALFGIVICVPLLVVMGYVGAQYAKSIDEPKNWAGRIPVVGLSAIDFRSRDGKLFQGFFLIVYVLLPAAGLVHFLRTLSVFLRAKVAAMARASRSSLNS
jgi:TRAP-type C4-dicarboxylate transport system permease small subunit